MRAQAGGGDEVVESQAERAASEGKEERREENERGDVGINNNCGNSEEHDKAEQAEQMALELEVCRPIV